MVSIEEMVLSTDGMLSMDVLVAMERMDIIREVHKRRDTTEVSCWKSAEIDNSVETESISFQK